MTNFHQNPKNTLKEKLGQSQLVKPTKSTDSTQSSQLNRIEPVRVREAYTEGMLGVHAASRLITIGVVDLIREAYPCKFQTPLRA